jgi:prolyl 4-hydroxylase
MSALAQAEQLARSGRQREAVALVEDAASRGDPDALFMFANWRLLGLYGVRDLASAHDLLRLAAEQGHVEAARLRAFLIGSGTGCQSDPYLAQSLLARITDQDASAAMQTAFLPRMMRVEAALARSVDVLSQEPAVRLIRGLLLAEECDYIRELAQPALRPSFVIDPVSRARVPHPTRTSMGMSFGPMEEDLVINAINRRIAAVTCTQVAWGEPLHILRYQTGQEFKLHLDGLAGVANQRRWTVLVYLNDGYEGGETEFPELGHKIRGAIGDAVIFENVGGDGRPDQRTRHAGRPVLSGAKWLATRWIRSAPYDPWTGQ